MGNNQHESPMKTETKIKSLDIAIIIAWLLITIFSVTAHGQMSQDPPDAPTLPVGTPWSAWWNRHSTNETTAQANLGITSTGALTNFNEQPVTLNSNLLVKDLIEITNAFLATGGKLRLFYAIAVGPHTNAYIMDSHNNFIALNDDQSVLLSTGNGAAQVGLNSDGTVTVNGTRLGNASINDTNTMTVFGATNAQFATTAATATNAPDGSLIISSNNFIFGITPEQFGAYGDGRVATNVSITVGSQTLTMTGTTVDGSQFSQDDVGKPILIYGAGQAFPGFATNCLSTIITQVVSSTQITISNAALTTTAYGYGRGSAVYGHDDTPALQAWLNFGTNVLNPNFSNKVWRLPNKIYVIAGPIIDPIPPEPIFASSNHKNSQLYLPDFPPQGHDETSWEIEGDTMIHTAEANYHLLSANGSILWSFYVATNYLPYLTNTTSINGYVPGPAVLTCQNWTFPVFIGNGPNYTNRFNAIHLVIKNVTIRLPSNPNISGFDFSGVNTISSWNLSVNTGYRGEAQPLFTNSFGIRFPLTFAADGNVHWFPNVGGVYNGYVFGEHCSVYSGQAISCYNAIYVSSAGHWNNLFNFDPEACKRVLFNSGVNCGIWMQATIEGVGAGNGWASPSVIINDWNNSAYGYIAVDDSRGRWDGSTTISRELGATNITLSHFGNLNGANLEEEFPSKGKRIIGAPIVYTNNVTFEGATFFSNAIPIRIVDSDTTKAFYLSKATFNGHPYSDLGIFDNGSPIPILRLWYNDFEVLAPSGGFIGGFKYGGETNVLFKTGIIVKTNGVAWPTNYSVANLKPIDGMVKIAISNNFLYSVTTSFTNAFYDAASGTFNGNGSGLTNATVIYTTNIVGGVTNQNLTTRAIQVSIPVKVTEPATTLGSAEIVGQIGSSVTTWITVAQASLAGGATSIIATNEETFVLPVPSGWFYRVTNNVSGTGYTADIDNSGVKTNVIISFP